MFKHHFVYELYQFYKECWNTFVYVKVKNVQTPFCLWIVSISLKNVQTPFCLWIVSIPVKNVQPHHFVYELYQYL